MASTYLQQILNKGAQNQVTGRAAFSPGFVSEAFQGDIAARYREEGATRAEAAREAQAGRAQNLAEEQFSTQKQIGAVQTGVSAVGAAGTLGMGYAAAKQQGLFGGPAYTGAAAGASAGWTAAQEASFQAALHSGTSAELAASEPAFQAALSGTAPGSQLPAAGAGAYAGAAGVGVAGGYVGGQLGQPVGEAIGMGGEAERGTVGGAIGGGIAGGALAGSAVMPGIGTVAGAIIGGVVGGITGLLTSKKGGTWICTEIDTHIGLSEDDQKALGKLRRHSLKMHKIPTKFYLKRGKELIDKMSILPGYKQLLVSAKRDMVDECVRLVGEGDLPSAYDVYQSYTTKLMKKYAPKLFKEYLEG
jgi:hypothetical protein